MRALIPLAIAATLLAACSKQEPAPAPTNDAPPAPAAAAPTPAVATAGNEKGEHVYKATCSMCHATGAGGAPTFKSKDDWGPRIAKGKDTLYAHALQGFTGQKGTMPAKGGNASLPDDDVKAAVDYMTAAAQ
jgi:cytochrome c5